MKTVTDIKNYRATAPLALSIGMFDGVHIGHQKIIRELISVAEEKHLQPAILSFWPHPRTVFKPNEDVKLLNTVQEKARLLENLGLKNLFLQDFNEEFRNLSGEEFIRDIVVETLQVKHLIIGYDHVFGKNRSGNYQLLQQLALACGYEVQQADAVSMHGATVSSTRIRNLLSEGQIIEANALLGYPYRLEGTVVHGKKIGRTLGFPTANLQVDAHKLLPQDGAYIVKVELNGNAYKGMMSIGTNPTVGGRETTAEVNIIGFSGDIYGKTIIVEFREFLHGQIKFENLELLKAQLWKDQRAVENFNFLPSID